MMLDELIFVVSEDVYLVDTLLLSIQHDKEIQVESNIKDYQPFFSIAMSWNGKQANLLINKSISIFWFI